MTLHLTPHHQQPNFLLLEPFVCVNAQAKLVPCVMMAIVVIFSLYLTLTERDSELAPPSIAHRSRAARISTL